MQVRIRTKGATSYLQTVDHEGRTYLIAPPEGEYEIVLTNNCNRRRMAVIAVDGMSVMDGKLAKRGDKNGYVLGAWQTTYIKGWRRTDQEVAAFAFTPNDGSYSNQVGNGTRNTGIISVAVFEEKEKPVFKAPEVREVHHHHYPLHYWWPHYPTVISNSPVSSADFTLSSADSVTTNSTTGGMRSMASASLEATATASAQPKSLGLTQNPSDVDLGTGYGSKTEMRTHSVTFECASDTPDEIVLFYYGTRERLRARNIPVDRAVVAVSEPNPFPGSACPAPPGWEG